ncbi:hypothetical protein QWY86_17910 [Pedobacter aquatilis]|uniref:hypothetical protein n=1 Tax=Pedobacter aquatilis TaxID=351343 RepID=UPI0025B57690|nr:hypothetical protein [Pedobacter aquatilis]MDN3588562.1 hypothetical protein [Pedobacter aquatilis]
MLRKGKITSINNDGSGLITDENEQEIPFTLGDSLFYNIKGADVNFNIKLTDAGLVAVDIQLATGE